jgi:hypothetical protein
VTYRDAGRPLCAACGTPLEPAHTYFDANGGAVCRACRNRGDLEEAQQRIVDAPRESLRVSRAFYIGRIVMALFVIGVLGLIQLFSRCR